MYEQNIKNIDEPLKRSAFATPRESQSFRLELKRALNERNALTTKSRKKLCDMLDDQSETPLRTNTEYLKKMQFRRQAVQEILNSEESYINQLDKLMKFFVQPLKERQIISNTQFNALFGQLEMIYNLNKELLAELLIDLDNVAKAFLRMGPFFKLYSVYAFDYNRAQVILQELADKNQQFNRFLEQTESRPEVQCKLISLLIAPIQRIPRYRLLLQQVLLYSSPIDPDFKDLQESIKEVENTVMHMNTVIEDQEVTQILIDLQNAFINHLPNIVKPGRKVIKQGVLERMSSDGSKLKRHCVLMSDIFIYCKILKEQTKNTITPNSLECCCIFPLKKCRVIETFPGTFKISCQGDGIILCTDDTQLSRNWINKIRETIELYIETRKTIRKDSSKRKPLRKKDLKHFDADQYLSSPSKRKNEYENVSRFLSDSDIESSPVGSCFSMNPKNVFKRKRKTDATECLMPITEVNENQIKFINLVDKGRKEQEKNHDPTYGFATFQQNNGKQQQSPVQDILFPLRLNNTTSLLSDNDKKEYNMKAYDVSPSLRQNGLSLAKRKRVTFNDLTNDQQDLNPKFTNSTSAEVSYQFPNVKSTTLSLRQKLTHFFTNLF